MKRRFLAFSIAGLLMLGSGAAIALFANNPAMAKATSTDVFWVQDSYLNKGEGDCQAGELVYYAWGPEVTPDYDYSNRSYNLSYTGNTLDFWRIQYFARLLHQEAGDNYEVKLTFTSDVAGSITSHGSVIALEANTPQSQTYTVNGTATLISVQLGVYNVSTLGDAGAGNFTMTVDYVYDNTPNTYHTVTFSNDSSLVDSIQVKDGKTVPAPQDPVPEPGFTFSGWYTSEDVKWTNDLAISKDMDFEARFISNSNTKTVSFYDGLTKLGDVNVPTGDPVAKPNYVLDEFGHAYTNWCIDDTLNNEWDFADAVNSDMDLYAVHGVAPSYWANNSTQIANYAHNLLDGTLVIEDLPAIGATNWHYQINFTDFAGRVENNQEYDVKFTYRISADGADVNFVFNGETRHDLVSSANFKTDKFTFTGGVPTKLSFELGSIAGDPIDFEIKSIVLQLHQDEPVADVSLPTGLEVGVGSDAQMIATLDGEVYSNIVWASDNTSVLTVSGNSATATLHGVSVGTANITVTVTSTEGTFDDTVSVEVVEAVYMKVYFAVKRTNFPNLGSNFAILSHGSVSLTNTPASATSYNFQYKDFDTKLYVATLNLTTLGIIEGGNVKANSWIQLGNTANGAWGQSFNYTTSDVEKGLFLTLEGWDNGGYAITKLGTSEDVDEVIAFCVDYMKSEEIGLDEEGSTPNCEANYLAAKSAVVSLTDNQRKLFAGTDYYARLQAWAKANGETFVIDSDGKISSANYINQITVKNNSSIVVIIAVISVVSIAGLMFFVIRRKRA